MKIFELIRYLEMIRDSEYGGADMIVCFRLHGEEIPIEYAEKRFDGSWNYVALRAYAMNASKAKDVREYVKRDIELTRTVSEKLAALPPPEKSWLLKNPDRWYLDSDGRVVCTK